MKVLFFARHFTYLRNFESALRLLSEHGHQVHIAVGREEAFGGREMVERLSRDYPGITAGSAPARADEWYRLATRLRLGLDYLRYLDPAYSSAPRIEARSRERAPRFVLALARTVARWPLVRRRLARWLWAIEQSVPLSREIRSYIRAQSPDAVLITPLLGVVASPELDYLYTAKALGVPTALCVWSWDHLSSKALIRTLPDRVLVWNPTQQREAIELHGVPPERVVVTGAQCFDQWFDRKPSRSREAFCARVGLSDSGPFVLWVCSALFKGSPSEATFVLEWIRALRQGDDPSLREVNVLVRPHPQRLAEWEAVDTAQWPRVALWGANPVGPEARADYFDSLHYSTAIVGLNTSAFIEGAIAGRPVYTVLPPAYRENQEGTIHFHYLLDGDRALLRAARTLPEHATQLAAALRGEVPDGDRSRRFVETFVRPQGLGHASTPIFVEAVESLPRVERAPIQMAATAWSRAALRLMRRAYRTDRGRAWIEAPDYLHSKKRAKDQARKQAAKLVRPEAGP
jgi:hypothetical protein